MDIVYQLDLLLENLMYNIFKGSIPINLTTKITFSVFLLLSLFVLIQFIIEIVKWLTPSSPSQKQAITPDQLNIQTDDFITKKADLHYQKISSDPKQAKRKLRGIYLAEKTDDLQEREKGYLILRFNGEWFLFRDPKALSSYQIELFDNKTKKLREDRRLDFKWGILTLQTLPQYIGQYQVEVKGQYPHLYQNDKRVFLLPTKIEDDSTESQDRFFLFEDIELSGGISWQMRKLFLWEGELLTNDEVLELQEDYLDLQPQKARPDVDMMK